MGKIAITIIAVLAAVLPSEVSHVEFSAVRPPGVTQFTFTFKTTSASHVKTYLDGVIQSSGLTVTLNANQNSSPGGHVDFLVAPDGKVVRVERTVPLTQTCAFTPGGALRGSTLEGCFDSTIMQTQQTERERAEKDAAQDVQIALGPGLASGDNVPVTASGGTAARTLAVRATDTVNVKDYGAVGDWSDASASANDAAFAAAIAAAVAMGKGRIYVPGGGYVISQQINIPLYVESLEGDGPYTTHLFWKTGVAGAGKAMLQIQQKKFRLSGIHLRGDSSVGTGSPDYCVWMYPTAENMSQMTRFETVSVGENCNVGIYVSKPPGGVQQEMTTISSSRIFGYAAGIRLNQDHIDLWQIDRSYISHTQAGGAGVDFMAPATAIGFTFDHVWFVGGSGTESAGIRVAATGLIEIVLKDSGPEGPSWGLDATAGTIHMVASGVGAGPGAIRVRNTNTALRLRTEGCSLTGGTVASPGSAPWIDAGTDTAVEWVSNRDILYEYNSGGRIEQDARVWYAFSIKKTGTARVVMDYSHQHSSGFSTPLTVGGTDLGGGTLSWFGVPLTVRANVGATDITRWQDTAGTNLFVVGAGGEMKHGSSALVLTPYTTNSNGSVSVIPNGTGTQSQLTLYSSSTTGQSPYLQAAHVGTEARLIVAANGAGTLRDLAVYAGGGERLRVTTAGAATVTSAAGAGSVQALRLSADRGDTSQTIVVRVDPPVQRWATTLTANRTVTLSTTGALNGDTFRVVRTGLGAFTLDVGGLKTIASATAAFVDVAYDGSAWVLTGYGEL